MSATADPLEVAREALAGRQAWLVGGAVRDRLLGRAVARPDLDLAVAGDVEAAARALGRAAARAPSSRSRRRSAPGASSARARRWQVDLALLAGETIEQDLAQRDFTVNAIAEPLAGGEPIDPTGGREDLAARRLRMVAPGAFAADPLRVLRVARFACELELAADPATVAAARERVARPRRRRRRARLRRAASGSSRRPIPSPACELMDRRRGDRRSCCRSSTRSRGRAERTTTTSTSTSTRSRCSPRRSRSSATRQSRSGRSTPPRVAALLAEPLADELTRGGALRFGALLHDIAKPQTRGVTDEGRVTFFGHDAAGADVARAMLGRLRASERLRAHVAALARHHLRLGFLVRERPLARRAGVPLPEGVRAGRGRRHAAVRRRPPRHARAQRGGGDREAPGARARAARPGARVARRTARRRRWCAATSWRDALGIAPGPRLGALLAELEEATYAGEVATREQAIAHARDRL